MINEGAQEASVGDYGSNSNELAVLLAGRATGPNAIHAIGYSGKGCCMAPLHFAMGRSIASRRVYRPQSSVSLIVSAGGVIELPVEYLRGLKNEL